MREEEEKGGRREKERAMKRWREDVDEGRSQETARGEEKQEPKTTQ